MVLEHSSPNLAKSADKMDGAMMVAGAMLSRADKDSIERESDQRRGYQDHKPRGGHSGVTGPTSQLSPDVLTRGKEGEALRILVGFMILSWWGFPSPQYG